MAIKIECIQLITSVDTAQKYFPEAFGQPGFYTDGIVCNPVGAMSGHDTQKIVTLCNRLGLVRFDDNRINEHPALFTDSEGYIASQLGWEDHYINDSRSWLRMHRGVAWHRDSPMGKNLPTHFPCEWGGFYYDSAKTWKEAEQALLSLTEELPRILVHQQTPTLDDLLNMAPLPAYSGFFDTLRQQSLFHSLTSNSSSI